MTKKLAYLLLICLSLSILGVAFHHHADGVSHHNCSLCSYISHHSNIILQDSFQITAPSFDNLPISLEDTVNNSYLIYHPYLIRAPPA
jgi:hypothetical protein